MQEQRLVRARGHAAERAHLAVRELAAAERVGAATARLVVRSIGTSTSLQATLSGAFGCPSSFRARVLWLVDCRRVVSTESLLEIFRYSGVAL